MKRFLAVLIVALALPVGALAITLPSGKQFATIYKEAYNKAGVFQNRLDTVKCQNAKTYIVNKQKKQLFPCTVKAHFVTGPLKRKVFCAFALVDPINGHLYNHKSVACPATTPVA